MISNAESCHTHLDAGLGRRGMGGEALRSNTNSGMIEDIQYMRGYRRCQTSRLVAFVFTRIRSLGFPRYWEYWALNSTSSMAALQQIAKSI